MAIGNGKSYQKYGVVSSRFDLEYPPRPFDPEGIEQSLVSRMKRPNEGPFFRPRSILMRIKNNITLITYLLRLVYLHASDPETQGTVQVQPDLCRYPAPHCMCLLGLSDELTVKGRIVDAQI